MSLQYIIDGYNLINHPQFIRRNKKTSCPAQSLLAFIKNGSLTGSRNNKMTVVFDGYPPAGYAHDSLGDNAVIFSRKISADEKIKMLIEERTGRKNIIVVSDDKEISSAARALGAQCMHAGDFIGSKDKTEKQKMAAAHLDPVLSYTQVHKINEELKNLWLK